MAKKKPHQRKGGIKQYYDENKPDFSKYTHQGFYSVKKLKKGFEVEIVKDRGIDEKIFFEDKKSMEKYLKRFDT